MKAFANLSQAVEFLSNALTSDDYDTLSLACQEGAPDVWVLQRLAEINQDTPLTQLYAGREFPTQEQQFKLGGHDKELGHIHIDFARTLSGWELQEIWMCR